MAGWLSASFQRARTRTPSGSVAGDSTSTSRRVEIFANAAREGLLEVFVDAGAIVNSPSCGPCYGNLAPLVEGDVCIGTGTTNSPGRMGSTGASIYLSNAITASVAAVAGEICDPRVFFARGEL